VLRHFIGGIDCHDGEIAPAFERILPGGRVHVFVNLDADAICTYDGVTDGPMQRASGAILEGPQTRPRVIHTSVQRSFVAVDFLLGGAAAFFRMPLSEARDGLVDLGDVWGRAGATLRERLLEARNPAAKRCIVEALLLANFDPRRVVDPAVSAAARALARGASVKSAAASVGVLPRTLARRFHAQLGVGPKRFSRLRRLQRVVASIDDPDQVDWCDIAAAHGYVDQAHLIHDFRSLGGITPTSYRPRSVESRNHVPIA
jgi:methylphosphotriester-DNA--protein-cysteine methyltransferase